MTNHKENMMLFEDTITLLDELAERLNRDPDMPAVTFDNLTRAIEDVRCCYQWQRRIDGEKEARA